MKRKPSKPARALAGLPAKGNSVPTAFDQMAVITSALREEIGLPPLDVEAPAPIELPAWGRNIVRQLGKTIFKPVLKLRPQKGVVNWRHYGQAIGVLERTKTFWEHDVPRIMKAEFADVSAAPWANSPHKLGLDQLRAHCIKLLGRPVAEAKPLDALLDELRARQDAHFDQLRQMALAQVALQPPKVAALFFKGLAEGYSLFLNVEAQFAGDRGRTDIYLTLLACMWDVEQLRRTLPSTTRSRYYDSLRDTFRFPPSAYDWFNDVCDDIKLPLNRLGRRRASLVG